MKKLRMIVTSVVVLAIVGSAFAFNAKKAASFCVSSNNTSACNVILHGKAIDPAGQTFFYYSGWTGTVSECTGNNCTAIKLIDNG